MVTFWTYADESSTTLILVPYGVDPDQLASQKLADLDLHSKGIVIIRQHPKFLLLKCFLSNFMRRKFTKIKLQKYDDQ